MILVCIFYCSITKYDFVYRLIQHNHPSFNASQIDDIIRFPKSADKKVILGQVFSDVQFDNISSTHYSSLCDAVAMYFDQGLPSPLGSIGYDNLHCKAKQQGK
jgi:hypothetical protein